jgi:hypothetical protein
MASLGLSTKGWKWKKGKEESLERLGVVRTWERRSAPRRRRETAVNACSIERSVGVDHPIPEE